MAPVHVPPPEPLVPLEPPALLPPPLPALPPDPSGGKPEWIAHPRLPIAKIATSEISVQGVLILIEEDPPCPRQEANDPSTLSEQRSLVHG
jgi:hypothetical protein